MVRAAKIRHFFLAWENYLLYSLLKIKLYESINFHAWKGGDDGPRAGDGDGVRGTGAGAAL